MLSIITETLAILYNFNKHDITKYRVTFLKSEYKSKFKKILVI